MVFVNGYCPVDPDDDIPYVIALSGESPVLLYCSMCGLAWRSVQAVETDRELRGLEDFGLSEQTIRYATEAEIRSAGLEIARAREPWDLFPRE